MEWKITLHEEENYAEIITSGIADKDSSLEMAKALAPFMMSNKISRLIVDHRNLEKAIGVKSDVYQRHKEFRNIGVSRPVKIAEIIRPEHEDFFNFLELVLRNRGYRVSIFHDKESALEWLQK